MGSTKVRWIGGKQFVGIDSTNHSVVLSTTDEGVGMKPSELLLVAVSSCSSVDVVDIMAKKRTPLDFLEVITSGEQDADPPWTFRKIHMTYRVRGKEIREEDIAKAIELSHKKYCSVASTISGVAEITTSFEILSEA